MSLTFMELKQPYNKQDSSPLFSLKDNKQNVFNLQKTKSIKKNMRYDKENEASTGHKDGSSAGEPPCSANTSASLFQHIQHLCAKHTVPPKKPDLSRQEQLEQQQKKYHQFLQRHLRKQQKTEPREPLVPEPPEEEAIF